MTRHAAAYIRRSSVSANSPGDASREAQQESTHRLATAFAPEAEIREYTDWGISGRKDDRPAYVALKAAIAADTVCCVFSYSLSRLGRTARELDSLFGLCEAHGVQVITQADGTLTATNVTSKFLRRILAELAELESELAKERTAAARAAKVERGDRFGQAPYGFLHAKQEGRIVRVPDPDRPLEPIIAAYRDAGSVLGACRLLEEQDILAPRGGKKWATSALTRILDENQPGLLPRKTREGRRSPSSAALAHLLICPFCERTLTPNTHRGQYYCPNGPRDRARHPRYTVTEADIMPWIEAEAGRVTYPADAAEVAADTAARKLNLIDKRDRWIEQYGEGLIDKAARDVRISAIDAELDDLAARQEAVQEFPDASEWLGGKPEAVNAALRALWRHVKLGPDLHPIRAEWIIPEWRS